MNKRFNDSYCRLGDKAYALTVNTRIVGLSDPVAREQIERSFTVSCDPTVDEVAFHRFDGGILERLHREFGEDVKGPIADSYAIEVGERRVDVYADTENAVRYAACSLRAHHTKSGLYTGMIYNSPVCSFRAVKNYLPAKDEIDQFYRFVDLCMYYGYNTMVIEVGGAMEYKKHPKINTYWEDVCRDLFKENLKTDMVQSSCPWAKNSIHIENGGGSYLSQDTVREIVAYCRSHGLEVIPEVPSLSHADYLLAGDTDFAERPDDPFPDVYCPLNEKSYERLFDVLEEVIDVFRPKTVHIGHDEWYIYGVCDKCRQKTPEELYAYDITKIHDWLAARGIGTMLWAEKLLDSHFDVGGEPCGGAHCIQIMKKTGRKVNFRGKMLDIYGGVGLSEEDRAFEGVSDIDPANPPEIRPGEYIFERKPTYRAIGMIPKDVICMNWYYGIYKKSDLDYCDNGLPHVFGNFSPYEMKNWKERLGKGYDGACLSNWGAPNDRQGQRKGHLFDVAFGSVLFWNQDYDEAQKTILAFEVAHDLFLQKNEAALRAPHLDILHTCKINIPHTYIGCGGLIDDDLFRLGVYRITYKDGTEEKREIFWGDHVSVDAPVLGKMARAQFEATYTADIVLLDGRMAYRLLLPVDREVEEVSFLPVPGHIGDLKVLHMEKYHC